MAKIADEYFKVNPWKVIEDGWNKDFNMVAESVFSLGNEYMGTRGYFEEGNSAPSLLGSYFNGIYEIEQCENTSYKGIVTKTHFMVNAADFFYTRITADDELLVPGESTITDFYRELDLQSGKVNRSYIWTTSKGKRIRLSFIRFLNMKDPYFAYQRIKAELLDDADSTVNLKITLGIDGNTIHANRKKCYWNEIATAVSSNDKNNDVSVTNIKSGGTGKTGNNFTLPPRSAAVYLKTKTTKQRLFSSFTWNVDESTAITSEKPLQTERFSGWDISINLSSKPVVIEKKIANTIERDNTVLDADIVQIASDKLQKTSKISFIESEIATTDYWKSFWDKCDIEIEGDEKNQQGIRFCIFQMHQTYHGFNSMNNIGAKGLTGESYNGHTFWDTETCCLPFFLFTDLKAAKNLLEYRWSTLKQAKERAKQLDCIGACYPVATLNGEEACNLFQHASCQFQPSTGVAYGIEHYVNVSGDKDFLFGHGIEMLIEISRFLISRGSWNNDHSGFGFYAVMGPDEFHMMVNNNDYTNFMAKKTFEYTLTVLAKMKTENQNAYNTLIEKEHLTDSEIKGIKECCSKMIILFDDTTQIYEQHEGYCGLPHIDINSIPICDFPLYNHWSYDRIYRTDMIKQPDVLMFIFLYSSLFTSNVKRANYEYYEPRTIHESSLSPSIHSILAAELGKEDEAYKFFAFATRMDLDNYNRNSNEGLHTTSIAAAWVNIVYGFGGMRSDGNILSFSPSLPHSWSKYSFRVVYHDGVITVSVDSQKVTITSTASNTNVMIYGKNYTLSDKPVVLDIPSSKEVK